MHAHQKYDTVFLNANTIKPLMVPESQTVQSSISSVNTNRLVLSMSKNWGCRPPVMLHSCDHCTHDDSVLSEYTAHTWDDGAVDNGMWGEGGGISLEVQASRIDPPETGRTTWQSYTFQASWKAHFFTGSTPLVGLACRLGEAGKFQPGQQVSY